MKYITLLLVGIISFLPHLVIAAPVHSHCDIKKWGPVTSTLTNPKAADLLTGLGNYDNIFGGPLFLNAFQFSPTLSPGGQTTSIPNCYYELSDITSIDITFTFTGRMEWDRLCLGNTLCLRPGDVLFDAMNPKPPITGILYDPPIISFGSNPFPFVSTTTTKRFGLVSHLGVGPPGPIDFSIPDSIEMSLPSGVFPITLLGPRSKFNITAASIKLSGNHYFIPEPGTILLLLAAIPGLLIRRKL